jgi:hypothetical protein
MIVCSTPRSHDHGRQPPSNRPLSAYKSRYWYGTNEDRSRQASASQAPTPDEPIPLDDPGFRFASLGVKTLDSLHENILGAVDAVFRPLVAAGEKLDALLGTK